MSSIIYSKTHPFLASIQERTPLTKEGAGKTAMHLVLNLEGSGFNYQVGDSIAIFPENSDQDVKAILSFFETTGKEIIQNPKDGSFLSFKTFLKTKSNLTQITRKLTQALLDNISFHEKEHPFYQTLKQALEEHFKPLQQKHHVKDLLLKTKPLLKKDHTLSSQKFLTLLMPLLPRFYSIASSPLEAPGKVFLTVALLEYMIEDLPKSGVCTNYLCKQAPLHQNNIPVYLQPNHGFTLPKDKTAPLIMIGPGTGIAPFRGFLKEREITQAKGKNWLFFGERHKNGSFFYEKELKQWKDSGLLTHLSLAFSRDQQEKVYVQHRLLEEGKKVFSWLEEGAYLFVCGDASKMAKDVEAALQHLIMTHGNKTLEDAKNYLKHLKETKRYLRDIY